MKKKFLLLFLAFNGAFAHDEKSSTEPAEASTLSPQDANWKSCVMEICGNLDPKKYYLYVDTNATLARKLQKELEDAYDAKAKEIMAEEASESNPIEDADDSDELQTTRFQDIIQKYDEQLESRPYEHMTFFTRTFPNPSEELTKGKVVSTLTKEQSEKELPASLPRSLKDLHHKFFVDFFNDPLYQKAFRLQSYPLAYVLKTFYPNKYREDFIRETLNAGAEAAKRISLLISNGNEEIENYLIDWMSPEIRTFLESNLKQEESAVVDLLVNSLFLEILQKNIERHLAELVKTPSVPISVLLNDYKVNEKIKEKKEAANNFATSDLRYVVQRSLHLNHFAMIYGRLPSKKVLDKISIVSDREVKKARNRSRAFLSKKSHASLFKEAIEFSVPPSKELFLRNFKKALALDNKGAETEVVRHFFYKNKLIESAFEDSQDPLKELSKIAQDLNLPPFDAAYEDSTVQVSIIGAHAPEYAMAIYKHEYGHILSKRILKNKNISLETQNWYVETKKCLSKKHPAGTASTNAFVSLERNDHRGLVVDPDEVFSQYAEEDFADYIAAKTGSPNEANSACTFFDPDRNDLGGLSLDDDPTDTHSSHLFRLLHVEKMKNGQWPEQCDMAYANSGSSIDFTPCP